MMALVSLLLILTLSLVITRVITVALILTGLSRDIAKFQATSAFSGAGFTTSESESVTNHPVRRRIILIAIRLGAIGVVAVASSLILTFVNTAGASEFLIRLGILCAGILLLYLAATSRHADRVLSRVINWALRRWTDLDARDYVSLLELSGDYRVSELAVDPGDWICDRSLGELVLNREGILVLGIHRRNGYYVGAPMGETVIHEGDRLILYGQARLIAALDERQSGIQGDTAHKAAILDQEDLLEEQGRNDQEQNRNNKG